MSAGRAKLAGVTNGEIRVMLRRVDPRQLRIGAGIRIRTVARALDLDPESVSNWETRRRFPSSPAGLRWVRFIAGLERHAQVTAELAAMERRAA